MPATGSKNPARPSPLAVWISLLAYALAFVSPVPLASQVRWTVNDLTVLEETDTFVRASYRGNIGLLYKEFSFDFNDPDIFSWFGEGRWTAMTLLSPSARTVPAYVALQKAIRAGESDFLDNRIDAINGEALFAAVDPRPEMRTSKAMLQQDRLWFVKGDDLWFQGRYFLQDNIPFSLADFQERGRQQSPGPRITIWEQSHIGVELKYAGKPTLRQRLLPVPQGRWFELTVHMVLDDVQGQVRVWQDGELIIDGRMQTLPEADSILNALEVGITATPRAARLRVDDIVISHRPLMPDRQ